MKIVWWALVFLVICVTFSALIHYEPGYVLLAFDKWSIETSFWAFLIAFLIAFFVLRLIFKLLAGVISLPKNWQKWSTDQKMKKLQQFNPAKILIADEQYAAAQVVLEKMRSELGDNIHLLTLLKTVYVQQKNWSALLSILPSLRKHQAISEMDYQLLSEKAYQSIFSTLNNYEDLSSYWKKMPSEMKDDTLLLQVYTNKLLTYPEEQQQAEKLLRKALNAKWDERLIENYAKINSTTPEKVLHQAERWFEDEPTRPGLALALAKLNLQQKIWGKAQYYLEYVIEKQPSPRAYYMLASLHDQLGNKAASSSCWQAGLALAVR